MKHLILSFMMVSTLAAGAFADLNRGIQLYNEGKFSEAAAVLIQVVSQQPKNGRALTYQGLARSSMTLPLAARFTPT